MSDFLKSLSAENEPYITSMAFISLFYFYLFFKYNSRFKFILSHRRFQQHFILLQKINVYELIYSQAVMNE